MTVDELAPYGMHPMDDAEVETFLASQHLGVLGLPTENGPYLLPMSYGFNGGSRLYFLYVVGTESQKVDLSSAAESVSFLVYSAETMFVWRSVLLTGSLETLPDEKRADLKQGQLPAWRPELFETASETEETRLYEFRIEDWSGMKHTGLPAGIYQAV